MHDLEDVIALYKDGLDPTSGSIVQRYRETLRKATYLELVQHAKYEGEPVHARDVQPVGDGLRPVVIVRPGFRTINLLQSASESGMTATMDGRREEKSVSYLGEHPQDTRKLRSSTYMAATSKVRDPLFSLQIGRRR